MTIRQLVFEDAAHLVDDASRSLLALIDRTLMNQPVCHVVLTGGSIAGAMLRATLDKAIDASIDWHAVHFWWGDERFVAGDDDDRNEKQARMAFLEQLPIPAENIHSIPSANEECPTPESAAEAYSAELHSVFPADETPWFDLILLGLGEDAHIASLFPGGTGALVEDQDVVAVRDSPKPPPLRVSLTIPALNKAREVWFVVSGAGKADALGRTWGELTLPDSLPAQHVLGSRETIWFVDRDAVGTRDDDLRVSEAASPHRAATATPPALR